jgi:flagella basal body P-ring formation protein FlgA
MIRIPLASIAALIALNISAVAQTDEPAQPHPVLKAEAVVTGDVVRIGDVVDHAGIIAKVPIFRAPDLGYTGSVSADDVVEAVRNHALVGLDTHGVTEVTVTRAARMIPAKDIESAVAQALSAQFDLGATKDIAVTFERGLHAMYVEPSAKGDPHVARLDYDTRTSRFYATIEIPTGLTSRGTLRLSGRAQAMVDVVTVAQAVERGSILKASDLMAERRPRAEAGRDAISDRDQAIGLAARAPLQPGRPLRSAELVKPDLVQRKETVSLVYQVPGITLTVRGRALEGGALGDTITVLNEQTKREVQGTISAPGRVVINTSSPKVAANLATTGH